ncbi:MAG: tyrosine-type recombinase/integrase [Candidatus Hodarchaeales archaeon]|jgi:integrase
MAFLYKRKYSSGKTAWAIRYRTEGAEKLHTIGDVDKRTALKEYHKFCGMLIEGINKSEKYDNVLFDDFKNDYLAHCGIVKKPSTMEREARVLKLFHDFTGNIRMREIDRQTIDGYIRHRRSQISNKSNANISRSTINLELRHLKAILNTALTWGIIVLNPLNGLKMLRIAGNSRPKYLKAAEVEHVIRAFRGTDFQNLVMFYLWTGVRLREALSLTWNDIDFNIGEITIRASNSKSQRYRYIGFKQDGKLGKILKSLKKRKDNMVFGPRDEKGIELPQWKPDTVSRKISKTCSSIGLDWASCHTFRHTFASHLAMAGVPLNTIKELQDHRNLCSSFEKA